MTPWQTVVSIFRRSSLLGKILRIIALTNMPEYSEYPYYPCTNWRPLRATGHKCLLRITSSDSPGGWDHAAMGAHWHMVPPSAGHGEVMGNPTPVMDTDNTIMVATSVSLSIDSPDNINMSFPAIQGELRVLDGPVTWTMKVYSHFSMFCDNLVTWPSDE